MGRTIPVRGRVRPVRLLTVWSRKSRYLNAPRTSRLHTAAPATAHFRLRAGYVPPPAEAPFVPAIRYRPNR